MSVLRKSMLILTVALLGVTATDSASARPNDGRYSKSAEARKKADYCDLLRGMLATEEAAADKLAGTKAAEKHAKRADETWAAGERAGCSWAK